MSDRLYDDRPEDCGDGRDGQWDTLEQAAAWVPLIRSSAEYVVVSRDLRANVIEAARAKQPASRRRWLGLMLAFILGISFCTWMLQRVDVAQSTRPLAQRTILNSSDELWLISQSIGAKSMVPGAEISWHLVDAYQSLRQRQAAVMLEQRR